MNDNTQIQTILPKEYKVELLDGNQYYIIGYLPSDEKHELEYIGIKEYEKLLDNNLEYNKDFAFFPIQSVSKVLERSTRSGSNDYINLTHLVPYNYIEGYAMEYLAKRNEKTNAR